MFHQGQTDETLKQENLIKIIFMCCLFYTLFETSKMIFEHCMPHDDNALLLTWPQGLEF
jgi:hypothetical protein